MSLNLSNKVWVYTERLYIHAHGGNAFVKLLKERDIEYKNELYGRFADTKPLYTFMSVEDYTFANFMQTVPTYKYLAVIESVIFDDRVLSSKDDNWNYYGEYIKNWYPKVMDLLKLAEVQVNNSEKKLNYTEIDYVPSAGDFLAYSFNDLFIDYIRREINEAHQKGLFLSVMFLCRKVLEVVFIRLFEVVFPKIANGVYDSANHELWYDTKRNGYRGFDTLIDNLKVKATAFHEDKDLVLELCALVKPFKDETNTCVHNDYKIPDKTYVDTWRIPYIINLSRKMYKKYCNP